MREELEALCAGVDLSAAASEALFARVVAGALSEVELAALVVALKAKGERPAEIAGAARALRAAATPFPRPERPLADTCGTGGDGAHTVNVSTAVALLAAELGIAVVKHGNRSVSSRCGSADVLEACGVRIEASPAVAGRCLEELGVCFLMAPQYHPGVRHAMPVRRALGTRTIFNLLGPLVNPARPEWQVLGVYDPRYCVPLAETLALLGCRAALVVHGSGLDELALHGPTTAALLRDGVVERLELTPADAGLREHPLEALAGGAPEENAAWLRTVLAGRGAAAHADAVALGAGALQWISGAVTTLAAGVAAAHEALARGGAAERLERLAERSRAD